MLCVSAPQQHLLPGGTSLIHIQWTSDVAPKSMIIYTYTLDYIMNEITLIRANGRVPARLCDVLGSNRCTTRGAAQLPPGSGAAA